MQNKKKLKQIQIEKYINFAFIDIAESECAQNMFIAFFVSLTQEAKISSVKICLFNFQSLCNESQLLRFVYIEETKNENITADSRAMMIEIVTSHEASINHWNE